MLAQLSQQFRKENSMAATNLVDYCANKRKSTSGRKSSFVPDLLAVKVANALPLTPLDIRLQPSCRQPSAATKRYPSIPILLNR